MSNNKIFWNHIVFYIFTHNSYDNIICKYMYK